MIILKFVTGLPNCPITKPKDHFTVVCLVAWSSNENEAGGDLVLVETTAFHM